MELAQSSQSVTSIGADPDLEPLARRRTRVAELQAQLKQLTETMRIAVIFAAVSLWLFYWL